MHYLRLAEPMAATQQSVLTSAICCGVEQRTRVSAGLATSTASVFAREIATFNRFFENRNSMFRGSSASLEVVIEMSTISASWP